MSVVWDRTADFLRAHAAAVVQVAALAIFVPAALAGIVAPLRPTAGPALAAALGLLGLVASIVSLWGHAAVSALALDPSRPWQAALAWSGRRLPLLVALALAVVIAIGLLAVPALVLLAAGGADFAAMSAGAAPDVAPAAAIAVALYSLALVAIVLWIAARLALLTPVVLAERRGFASLRRSWALTRGWAMRIVGVLLLYALVALVAVLAVRTVAGSILALIAGGEDPVTVASVLTALLTAAVGAGFRVLAAAFVGKLYLAARDRLPNGA